MPTTLCDLFAESAKRYPQRTAVIQGDTRFTYATLAGWQSHISHYLRQAGLQKGQRVAVLLQNSAEYIAVYYAVLAAGGVVVALNTAAKAKELCHWIQHCEASWLFVESAHAEWSALQSLLPVSVKVVQHGDSDTGDADTHVTQLSSLITGDKHDALTDCVVDGHDLAAIIYTSGTTGQPKGVTLSHANLYANTCSILDYLHLQHEDCVLNVLPFTYAYGNSVMHTVLATGASMVIENSMMYPRQVLQKIAQHRVTVFPGVPSTFALLLNRTSLHEYDLSSLRCVTQAGGAMPTSNIDRWRQLVPHAAFIVMYGQTEASARLTWLPEHALQEKQGSVGIPVAGVSLDIRDEQGVSLPDGEVGEIWAQGGNVMQGYWDDAALTATVLQDGWLKTGDLACRDQDGYYTIVGRSSQMIKSGAHRISPQEIEERITELDCIAEAAAIGVDDAMLGQIIKLVIVAKAGCEADKKTVLAYCRQHLALYKLPKIVEFVDALPKTASGKVHRFKLQKREN